MESEESIRDARHRRRQAREHGDEISKASDWELQIDTGDMEQEGEKVTGVAGEEDEGFEEEEQDRFEPFNLRQEMNEGYFDQSGHYIWQRTDKEDPWETELHHIELQKGKKVLAKKKKTIAEIDEEVPPPTRNQVNQWKSDLVALLEPRENVLHALKRLNPHSRKPHSKKGNEKKEKQEDSANMDPTVKIKFDRVTELADNLMSAGYHDVYSNVRELILDELKSQTPTRKRQSEDNEQPNSKRSKDTTDAGTPQTNPGGDFVWHEQSGMYLDPNTGWFHNPIDHTSQWFDENTQTFLVWDETTQSLQPKQK